MFTVLHRRASTVLDPVSSKQLIQSKFRPTSSLTNEWSEVDHKDVLLTSLLKASGRCQVIEERRQHEAILSRI